MKFKINKLSLIVLVALYFLLFLLFLQKSAVVQNENCFNDERKNKPELFLRDFNNSITIINREFDFETGKLILKISTVIKIKF